MSDPDNEHTQTPNDLITTGFNHHKEFGKLKENTPSVKDIHIDKFDALYVAVGGSHGHFKDDKTHHKFVADFYERGKVVALLCYWACLLL